MSSKGGGAQVAPHPPPPLPLSVECCMCGDHGLSRELFRCRSCNSRYQHKYCSDLYPKTETYKSCNWCLREDGKKIVSTSTDNNNNSSSISSSATAENNNNNNSNSSSNGSSSTSSTNAMKLQRGAFSSQLDKPVKKQRSLVRSSSEVVVRAKTEDVSSAVGRGRHGFRGKIRRYKLLEEVSS